MPKNRDQTIGWEDLELQDAEVSLVKDFYDLADAQALFERLRDEVVWRQDKITFYGKEHDLPRLQQWHGDSGLTYTWSGIRMEPLPWTPLLRGLRRHVEEATGTTFNTVLLNRYRSGQDTVSWHADDEESLGRRPTIASLSFGVERDFLLKRNGEKSNTCIPLPPGSLLVMSGPTQQHWKHCLPRRKKVNGERINLTFRNIVDAE